ncbi:uncharacterized protein LOC129192083 [Dunckerocampus dactyliophorus]|uniref:uncharacterized protein LOC129192083 n=1 Tax=Dunckerocampus dactyliophorus TaxID=161453 RepID=UPI002406A828|nr:uncharacterized protein LOC129192083 [Dunckerocampus dactyliophorus]
MSGSRVFIGRLSPHARERDVEKFFKGFGRIREINLKNGFGFVEFDDHRDADDAVYELNGKELCSESSRRLRIRRTCNMQQKADIPRKKPQKAFLLPADTILSTLILGLIFITMVPARANGLQNLPEHVNKPDSAEDPDAHMLHKLDTSEAKLKVLEARIQAQEAVMLEKLSKLERDIDEVKLKALEARILDKLDKDTTEAKYKELKERVERLYEVADKRKVGFSASQGDIKRGDKVVFGAVYANVGDTYNSTTGVFTAPCKGLYFFTLTYHKKDGNIDLGMDRKKENEDSKWILGVVDYTYHNHHSATSSRIIELEKGETVFVTPYDGHNLETTKLSGHCVFSGFLITPM